MLITLRGQKWTQIGESLLGRVEVLKLTVTRE